MIQNQVWPAPAKINLFLHVLGRRSDGFHDLQTLFQFLDFGDELRFDFRDDGALRRQGGLTDVPPEQDLVIRAAKLLREQAALQGSTVLPGVDIHVSKNIPAQGGLGGGSSDAATTLVVLNRLWGLNFDEAMLAKLGIQLGSDVPVFIHGRATWAEGRGERFQAVPSLPEPWYLLVHPGCGVSTAALFAAPELPRDTRPIGLDDYFAHGGGNDFEALVLETYPEIAQVMSHLEAYGRPRLTGTGACVFLPLPDRATGEQLRESLPGGWWSTLAQGVNLSSLHRALDRHASS